MTARLLKAERLKVRVCNHARAKVDDACTSFITGTVVFRRIGSCKGPQSSSKSLRTAESRWFKRFVCSCTWPHLHIGVNLRGGERTNRCVLWQPYLCASTCSLILRWKTCILSWWRWGKRGRSSRVSSWKLLSILLSHALTTSTGRWEEADGIGQVMNISLSEQRGAADVLPPVNSNLYIKILNEVSDFVHILT